METAKPAEVKAAEAKPKADKPEAPAPKSSEAKPPETKPAAKLLDSRGQPASYALLAHPSIAERLKLTDQQRAKVAELMTERSEAMAKAGSKDRAKVLEECEAKLAGVLTDEQRSQWSKTPPEPLLRFNYRFQRWVDVLEEVAKQAGLSLVLEAPPPGTFNYSDSREYTPTEAIDLLNGVLVTKGFTLVRREKMLVLVDLSEGIPEGLIPRVTLDELDSRGKFEMVSVLFPLKGRNAATVSAEITPLLGPRGKIVPLPTTGQLLLTDTAGIMKAISAVIESMPIPAAAAAATKAPETPSVVVYSVKNADPAAALKVLQALLPTATFAVDSKADQIHAYGGPTVQAAVKSVIEQMQSNAPADKKPRLERYPLGEATAPELIKTLTAIVPEAKLSRDPQTGALIAWATPAEQETIKGAVEKLAGDHGIEQSRQFQVYRLTKADPATATTLLQELFPRAKIAVDKPTENLVVIGTLAEQKAVQGILEQLQAEKTGPGALELKAYPVTTADAASALATLKTLYPHTQIALDAKGQRLLVTAIAADQAAVKASLDQIQAPTPKEQQSRFESYRLHGADPATLIVNLQTLVPHAKVTADRTAGTLVVFGTPAEHQMVQGALEKLGHGQGMESTPQVEIHAITKADPKTLLATLQPLVPEAKLTIDAPTKSLVALAVPADQKTIRKLLEQIQSEKLAPDKQPRLETYPIHGADATQLVPNLQSMIPDAKITVDAKFGKLVVWGTPAEHETIKAALEKLGRGQGVEATPQLEVYRLSKVEPSSVLATLQSLAPDAKLVVDAASKSVIALAVPADQKAIRNVLEQLQSGKPAADSPQLRFYPLSQTPPAAMLSVLQALAPKAQVTLDSAGRRLTVVATPEDHEVLKSAIEQVDKTVQAEEKRKLVAYAVSPSQRTRFQGIAASLTTELPGMQVMPDGEPGELMIWAKPSQHVVIAELLEQLKREVPTSEKYELVAYAIKAASPTSLQSMLKTLFPNVQITPDARSRRLLIWALPADQQAIKTALEKIDAAKSADMQEKLMVYPVPYLDPTITVQTLQEALPEVKIVSDAKAGTLVVWASPWEHETIDKLLKQMQAGADAQNKPKLVVYPVAEGDPTAMVTVLHALVPKAHVVADAKARTIGATATAQDHELIASAVEQMSKQEPPEKAYRLASYTVDAVRQGALSTLISILSEQYPNAKFTAGLERNHLFVWARPDDQKKIQASLDDLAKNLAPPDLGYKLAHYTFESGGSVAVNNAIGIFRTMFPDAYCGAGSDPGSLLVWARPQDQTRIAQIVKEVGKVGPPETAPRLEVYTLQATSKGRLAQAPNLGAITVLKTMFPDVQFSPGNNPRDVVVLARPAEHVKIKAALAELDKKEPPDSAPRVVVYTLETAGPAGVTGAIGILQTLFPDAQFSAGTEPRSLVALARPDDHQAIKAAVEEISKKEPPDKAYRLATYTIEAGRRGAISTLISILSEHYPNAKFTPGLERGHLFAWARPDDQKRIQATLDELTKNMPPPDMGYKLVIYTLESGGAAAVNSAMGILKSMFPDASVSAGSEPGKLVVWARPQDHPRIAPIVKEVGKAEPPETAPRIEVYVLHSTPPSSKGRAAQSPNVAAVTVLQTMFPEAQFSPGTDPRHVVALARPAEHVKIKAAVAELDKKEPPESAPRVVAYTLESAGPAGVTGAIGILQTLFPDAQFSAGSEPGSVVALARPDEQQAIKAAIEEMSKKEPPDKAPSVATYRLEAIDAVTAVTMFRTAFADARFSAGVDASTLVVWARPADQALIKKTIAEIESAGGPNDKRVLSIYPFKSSDVTALSQLLDPALRRGIQLVPDPVRNRLLVWADAKHQTVVKGVIEQFARETAKTGEPTSQVYRFAWADPRAAYSVLTTLVPNAQIALDPVSHALVVSAMPEDHAKIKATVAEMDRRDANGQTPRLEIYRFQASDPADALPVLQGLFRLYPDVRLSLDTAGGAIVALATPAQHETIRSLVEQVEKQAAVDGGVSLRTYPLGEADGASTLRMLTALLEKEGRKVHLSIEPYNNSLVAIARPEQHKAIQAALEQLKPEERTLEVFQLEVLDPSTAELAIERLFSDGSFGLTSSAPTVDIDNATQQLLIRATAKQHTKIRELLVRMGETGLGQSAGVDARRSRQIPFDGDLNAALTEIRRVWPQIRPNNPLQVVSPPPKGLIRERPSGTPAASDKKPIRQAAGPEGAPGKPIPKNEVRASAAQKNSDSPKPPPKAPAADAPKPVIVVPGEGTVTISSDDPTALNQLEMLLRTMSQQRGAIGRNYSVYLLRNAKAASVAATLQQVFRILPGGAGRGLGRTTLRGGLSGAASVVIVPDERLNAIVAYANRTDRLTIESLLKVLDTADMPEPLAADRLQLIPIKNAGAEKIMQSLMTMFRSHVDGFSVEETTNSVVVIAAPETVEEIKRVANILDEAAGSKASREVEIVPLRKIKSEQVERALEIILKQPQRGRVRSTAGSGVVPAIPAHPAAPAHQSAPAHPATRH